MVSSMWNDLRWFRLAGTIEGSVRCDVVAFRAVLSARTGLGVCSTLRVFDSVRHTPGIDKTRVD